MKDASASPSVAFDLARFEKLAQLGDPAALPALRQILDLFERGADLVTSKTRDPDAAPAIKQYTRLAGAIGALLASPNLELSLEACDWLAYHSRHLAAVFRMAWPDGPDRIFHHVREAHGKAGNGTRLRNVLAAHSIAVSEDLDWHVVLESEPQTTLAFFLASFTHRVLLDEDATRRQDRLFKLAPQIVQGELREATLPVLTAAWMLCSYATAPDRHALKRHLNRLIQELFARHAISSAALPSMRPRAPRPTIVVVSEVLLGDHVMFKGTSKNW